MTIEGGELLSPTAAEEVQDWVVKRYLARTERRLEDRRGAAPSLGQRKHARAQWAAFWRRERKRRGDSPLRPWASVWWLNDWHHRERRRLTKESSDGR